MDTFIYEKDWAETSLGAISEWPESLRTALNICLISDAPASICWGSELIFLCNDAWKDLFGVHSSSLGQPAREVFEDNRQVFKSYFKEVLANGEVSELTNHTLSLGKSEEQTFNISFSPIFGSSGAANGIYTIAKESNGYSKRAYRDITDRKHWKRTIEESENRYRTLIENFPKGAVGLFDDDLRYTALGGELVTQIGITPEDRIGNKITAIYPKEIIHEAESYFYDVFKGKANTFEVEFHDRHLHCQTFPIENNEGIIISGMLVVQDITERWQAQQKLRESEAKFRMLTENINEVIWMASEDGEEFLYINPAFEEIWGTDREQLYDEPSYFLKTIHPEDRDRVRERFTGLPDRVFDDEYRIIRPDGEVRWLQSRGIKIYDEKGGITRIIGTTEDITDRKEAQNQLEIINETLEERVKERTQKLRSYQKQLRSLASQLNKAEEQERQRLASELHDKLGQMLTVAKMKVVELSGQPSSDLGDLKQMIDDAFKYIQNLMMELTPPPALNKEDVTEVLLWTVDKMEKQGLDITIEDDGQLKPVNEEFRSILHQSVRELFQNVKKHADTEKARMEMSREKDGVRVVIEDKGKGFDVKANRSIPTEAGRFGLFNIKERMDWHGGTFEMYSEPGEGTKAVLIVPVKEVEGPNNTSSDKQKISVSHDKKEEQAQQQQRIKVLLADDHEMVRRGFRQLIETQNDLIIVGEASHGQEAVELADKLSPDVIVMDVNMPVMDGIEATRKIKSNMPHVRIIGLSLHESREVIKNMHNAGASAYLTKNEAFESLIMTIRAGSLGLNS